MPDPADAVRSWSIELHAEPEAPASMGARKTLGQGCGKAEKEDSDFIAEVAFRSAAALTHIKSRCETLKGGSHTKAVQLPLALDFMAGDVAFVEINVYGSQTARIPPPSVEVFQEPSLGRGSPAWLPGLKPRLSQVSQAPALSVQTNVTAQRAESFGYGAMIGLALASALRVIHPGPGMKRADALIWTGLSAAVGAAAVLIQPGLKNGFLESMAGAGGGFAAYGLFNAAFPEQSAARGKRS